MLNEDERLRSLIATGLLDTQGEERFDRLTRLASNTLGAKIALISLVDSDRQWFKSKVGLDIDQTPRSVSFCDHAIRTPDEVMVVLDARRDDRFRDNTLVTGDSPVIFYAGAPLVTKSGHPIGSLCVIDDTPRDEFSDVERDILRDLARGVMTEIEAAAKEQQIDDMEVINRELQHRMGNLYAQVSGVASLIGKSEADVGSFMRKLNENIRTMSQVQTLFAANKYDTVPFRDLVENALLPFSTAIAAGRITVEDSHDLMVSERGAFLVTLVLNELATNATKHGALSRDDGTIVLDTDHGDGVTINWRENFSAVDGKNEVTEGFGSRILRDIAPRGLDGRATLDFSPKGFDYVLTASPRFFAPKGTLTAPRV